MSKPTVTYSDVFVPPVDGYRAVVRLAGSHHTISDERLANHDNVVTTSTVVKVNEDRSFETQNTIYVPQA